MSVVVYFLWFNFHGKIAKQNVAYGHNHFLPHRPPPLTLHGLTALGVVVHSHVASVKSFKTKFHGEVGEVSILTPQSKVDTDNITLIPLEPKSWNQ